MQNGSETAVGQNFYAIRGPHVWRFRTDNDAAHHGRLRAEGAQSSAPSLVEDGAGLDFHSHHLTVSEYKEIHFKIAGGAGRPVTEISKGAPVIAIGQESRLGVKHGCHSDEAGKNASYTCVFPANTQLAIAS